VGKAEGKTPLGVDGMVISIWITENEEVVIWIGFICGRIL
jgi:hypothetical protein